MHLIEDEDEDGGRRLRREGNIPDRWCLGSGDVLVGRQRGESSPGPHHVTRSQIWVDRISALPDDLLLKVLNCVHCARTAARTSLLGQRWRWVWRDLPELSFRGLTPEAIHVALARFTCTSLEAIDIHVSRGTGHRALDASSITSLLHAAAGRFPVKLSLTIPYPVFLYFTVDLPRFDFTTSIKLDVRGVCFALSAATEFPKLETLSLSGCTVDLATLVSRCPRLRVLSVTNTPHTMEAITVHSASLKELIVSTFLFTATIDIVAPALRKLTLSVAYRDIEYNLSVVAPMVEEVAWHQWRCGYYNMLHVRINNMWSVRSLKVRAMEKVELTDDDGEGSHQPRRAHVLSLDIFDISCSSQRDLVEELKEIPVTAFRVLELKISTRSHVLGPVLLDLLQICTAVQRLDVVLVDTRRELVTNNTAAWCKEWCVCQENNRKWRTETTISLMDLTEVEIKGLKGDEEEIHFLKMLFRSAPMLQTMTLILSDEVTNGWYNIFLNTVKDYPYVNSSVCISVD